MKFFILLRIWHDEQLDRVYGSVSGVINVTKLKICDSNVEKGLTY
jgi:hypothetical protein